MQTSCTHSHTMNIIVRWECAYRLHRRLHRKCIVNDVITIHLFVTRSIGCILYELSALEHAFEGQSLMGVMYKIVEGECPKLPEQYSSDLYKFLTKYVFLFHTSVGVGSRNGIIEQAAANGQTDGNVKIP